MDFYVIDKDYVSALKNIDNKVGDIDYGKTKLKFHVGIILEINNINYYVPVSSPKSKHYKMSDSLDFIKIYNKNGQLLCILNLNNMIPVPMKCVTLFKNKDVNKYRLFSNLEEEQKYVMLLQNELISINNKEDKIKKYAKKLYNICYLDPNSTIAKRCCDFKKLEKICENWI